MRSKRFARLIKILSGAAANAEDEILVLENCVERFAHFWVLVVRQFVRHRCPTRATALSYATLLAFIPVLAIALGITSGMLKGKDEAQFQHAVEQFIDYITPPATISTNTVAITTNAIGSVYTNTVPIAVSGGQTNVATGATN